MTDKLVKGLIGFGVLAGLGYVIWTYVISPNNNNTGILETPITNPVTYNYAGSGSPYSGSIIPSNAYHVNISA